MSSASTQHFSEIILKAKRRKIVIKLKYLYKYKLVQISLKIIYINYNYISATKLNTGSLHPTRVDDNPIIRRKILLKKKIVCYIYYSVIPMSSIAVHFQPWAVSIQN